jgi:hypothetical protein
MRRQLSLVPLLGLLAITACQGPVPRSADSPPPAGSYRVDTFTLVFDGATETLRGASVTGAYFDTAKALPFLGRVFTAEDFQSGRPQVVVLRHKLWQERFRSDPTWIGKTLQLNGAPFTIVGVMPATFGQPPEVDLWAARQEPPA